MNLLEVYANVLLCKHWLSPIASLRSVADVFPLLATFPNFAVPRNLKPCRHLHFRKCSQIESALSCNSRPQLNICVWAPSGAFVRQSGSGHFGARLLHHPPVEVCQPQRRHVARETVWAGPADFQLWRPDNRLGPISGELRARHSTVHPQGRPQEHATRQKTPGQVTDYDISLSRVPNGTNLLEPCVPGSSRSRVILYLDCSTCRE